MKIEIEQHSNGFSVKYEFGDTEKMYVYKSTDDLLMLEEIAKKFLGRAVTVAVK